MYILLWRRIKRDWQVWLSALDQLPSLGVPRSPRCEAGLWRELRAPNVNFGKFSKPDELALVYQYTCIKIQ